MKKALILGSLLVFFLAGCSNQSGVSTGDILSPDDAKAKAEEFINNTLIPAESPQKASVENITEEDNLYKLSVKVGEQTIDSFMTKNGKKFFPQGENIEEAEKNAEDQNQQNKNQPAAEVSKKAETPGVELFVMSHCPYGTQMEKAILPVVKTLGEKIDFELKFCDYAMHDKKEIDEQLRQHCIKEEQPEKLISYLECFLASSDAEKCMSNTGVNASNVESCVARTDKEYGITEDYNDKSTWKGQFPTFSLYAEDNKAYGISGSPSVVINGEKIQAQRNPQALLDLICSGFEEQPEECDKDLSTKSPAPGFGEGTSENESSASCG